MMIDVENVETTDRDSFKRVHDLCQAGWLSAVSPPPILVYDCGSFGGLHDTHNSAISFRNADCRSDRPPLQLGHEMSDVSIQCNIH